MVEGNRKNGKKMPFKSTAPNFDFRLPFQSPGYDIKVVIRDWNDNGYFRW